MKSRMIILMSLVVLLFSLPSYAYGTQGLILRKQSLKFNTGLGIVVTTFSVMSSAMFFAS